MERIKNFFQDEAGATAVEYALLVAFIALVITAGVTVFADALNTWFNTVGGNIGTWNKAAK